MTDFQKIHSLFEELGIVMIVSKSKIKVIGNHKYTRRLQTVDGLFGQCEFYFFNDMLVCCSGESHRPVTWKHPPYTKRYK